MGMASVGVPSSSKKGSQQRGGAGKPAYSGSFEEVSSASEVRETWFEFTLHSAQGLNNAKFLGRMSPCAVLSVNGTSLYQVSSAAKNGGTSPTWEQTFLFFIPEHVLRSENPKPFIKVEVFRSSKLKRQLGSVDVPLVPAIAHYEEACFFKQGVILNGRFCGTIDYSMTCARTSFAPPKGTPEHNAFVRWLEATPSGPNDGPEHPAVPKAQEHPAPKQHTPQVPPPPWVHHTSGPQGYSHQAFGYPVHGFPMQHTYPKYYAYNYPQPQPQPQVIFMEKSRPSYKGAGLAAGALVGLLLGCIIF